MVLSQKLLAITWTPNSGLCYKDTYEKDPQFVEMAIGLSTVRALLESLWVHMSAQFFDMVAV